MINVKGQLRQETDGQSVGSYAKVNGPMAAEISRATISQSQSSHQNKNNLWLKSFLGPMCHACFMTCWTNTKCSDTHPFFEVSVHSSTHIDTHTKDWVIESFIASQKPNTNGFCTLFVYNIIVTHNTHTNI